MMQKPTESPRDLARTIYRNLPQAPQPMEVDGEPYWKGVEHLPEWQFCERLAERLHQSEHRDQYRVEVALKQGQLVDARDAIADVLCWIAGFKAAGGDAFPADANLDKLRVLKRAIDRSLAQAEDPDFREVI